MSPDTPRSPASEQPGHVDCGTNLESLWVHSPPLGAKHRPGLAPGFIPLIQFQVIANTTAVEPDPVNPFNPFSFQPVALEGFTTEIECFGSLLFANECDHDFSLFKVLLKELYFSFWIAEFAK
jgi:hypothetical protein